MIISMLLMSVVMCQCNDSQHFWVKGDQICTKNFSCVVQTKTYKSWGGSLVCNFKPFWSQGNMILDGRLKYVVGNVTMF